MSNGGFTFKIRTQFSCTVSNHTLSLILGGFAKQNINITGYLQTKPLISEHNSPLDSGSDWNIVRFVVGSPDAETGGDLQGVRKVLECLDVQFQEKSIIQIVDIPVGVPGIINSIYGALWCKVVVYALYIGEETRIFIDTSDICEALLILSQTPLPQCPKECGPSQPEKRKKLKRN